MPSICLIGNCHVANLKLGWPAIEADFAGFALTFFASDGLSLNVEIVDGRLVAPDPDIRARMALTSRSDGDIAPVYDAYVVCGLALSSMRALRTVKRTRAELREAGREASAAAIAAGMEPTIRASIAIDVIAKLRQLTSNPIFLIATPLTAYERHADLWDGMRAAGRIDLLMSAFNLACSSVAAECNAIFVPQPQETVGPFPLTTRPEFYRLPPEEVRKERAHHTHMNQAFGSIVLRDVLQRIMERPNLA